MAKAPQVLVYVHEDRLGDALLKLPAVAALREAFPEHRITWLAGLGSSLYATQLRPLVSGLLDDVEDRLTLGRSWTEIWRRPALTGSYDIIIDTQTVVRSSLALRRIPHRLFISPAARFLLSDRRPGARERFNGSMRQRLMRLVALAAGREIEARYVLQLPAGYRRTAAELLPEGPVYVGLAPGAGGRDKCWPLEGFLELGREQRRRGRVPVYLIGPAEREWIPLIRERVPQARIPEQDERTRGHAGPLLALALAERLSAGAANDSGTGHILAAAGCPRVALFGRTSREKFADERQAIRVLRAGDFGGPAKMAAIPTAAVADALDDLLREQGGGGDE